MRVLVACEESQRVCTAFRERGHIAYSCDIQEPSGGHPEWHILGDVLEVLDGGGFDTMDGSSRYVQSWDIIIAHPPCTYLTAAGARLLFDREHMIVDEFREREGWKAAKFFRRLLYADCPRVCVENPAPMHYFRLPPYTQIVEPYMFGHPWKKRTCLWLRGLPPLEPTDIVKPTSCWVQCAGRNNRTTLRGERGATSAKDRSKTFEGIARAMAEQWGGTDI